METITLAKAHELMRAQGVSHPRHYAFTCPICSTVQSMASLVRAGAKPDEVERYIAFSCEGRFSNAGPWPSEQNRSRKAAARRRVRGCDWTLGGLFQLHRLTIEYPDGQKRPAFEIASPEAARALEAQATAEAA